jgi:hypothetical protein
VQERISEEEPDERLKIATRIVVQIYAPVYFEIKKSPGFGSGPKIYFEIVRRMNICDLPESVKENIRKTLTTNSFWIHPENILVAMLLDQDEINRGVKYVLKARENLQEQKEDQARQNKEKPKKKGRARTSKKAKDEDRINSFSFRIFKHPANSDKQGEMLINFEAYAYWKLVDLDANTFEPPITMGLSREELENFSIPAIPNNSQCVEFYVQQVYKEALKVSTDDRRNGNVLIKDFYRKNKMSDFKTVHSSNGKIFNFEKGFRQKINMYFPGINYN